MDYAACNVVYVDRTVQEQGLIRRGSGSKTFAPASSTPNALFGSGRFSEGQGGGRANLQTLLETFSEGAYLGGTLHHLSILVV